YLILRRKMSPNSLRLQGLICHSRDHSGGHNSQFALPTHGVLPSSRVVGVGNDAHSTQFSNSILDTAAGRRPKCRAGPGGLDLIRLDISIAELLIPHSPDNVLSFGVTCAIQI